MAFLATKKYDDEECAKVIKITTCTTNVIKETIVPICTASACGAGACGASSIVDTVMTLHNLPLTSFPTSFPTQLAGGIPATLTPLDFISAPSNTANCNTIMPALKGIGSTYIIATATKHASSVIATTAVAAGSTIASTASAAGVVIAPYVPVMAGAAATSAVIATGVEYNARKRDRIKSDRIVKMRDNEKTKMEYEEELKGYKQKKQELRQQLKDIKDDINSQNKKMYAVNDITYDGNTKFIVTLGVTGDGKSTVCNRLCGDESEEGDEGDFKTDDSAHRVTPRIKCKKVYIEGIECMIVDTPGFDDTANDDIHHANNLAEHLNAWGGANAFVLIHNGTNGRLKRSIQSMIVEFKHHFGTDAFWSHLCIILTHIESKCVINKIEDKKDKFIKGIHDIFAESKAYDIRVKAIGFHEGYNITRWRRELIKDVSNDKALCDKMTAPICVLKQKRNGLQNAIGSLNVEIVKKEKEIAHLATVIKEIQHQIDNCKRFVLFE